MKRSLFIAAASLLCFSQSALADGASGAYLGAGFSTNRMTSSCADSYFSSSCNDPSESSPITNFQPSKEQ